MSAVDRPGQPGHVFSFSARLIEMEKVRGANFPAPRYGAEHTKSIAAWSVTGDTSESDESESEKPFAVN